MLCKDLNTKLINKIGHSHRHALTAEFAWRLAAILLSLPNRTPYDCLRGQFLNFKDKPNHVRETDEHVVACCSDIVLLIC